MKTRTGSKIMACTCEAEKITVQNNSKQSSSTAKLSVLLNTLANVTAQPFLHVTKICYYDSLLPAYFVTSEKYFEIDNIIDENMRFDCLSNVVSPSRFEAYGFALSRVSENIKPYISLKNSISSSVSVECNSDRIDVLSKTEYANALLIQKSLQLLFFLNDSVTTTISRL